MLEIFDKRSQKGDEALTKILESGDKISVTAINLHAITYGLLKYAKPVKELLQLPVLNYTKDDAHLSAKIELEAERAGKATRRTDAMIAAVTINNGAKLYTFDRNTSTISQPKGSDYFPNRTRHSQFPHDRPEGHPAYQKLPTHKRRDLLFSRSAWER